MLRQCHPIGGCALDEGWKRKIIIHRSTLLTRTPIANPAVLLAMAPWASQRSDVSADRCRSAPADPEHRDVGQSAARLIALASKLIGDANDSQLQEAFVGVQQRPCAACAHPSAIAHVKEAKGKLDDEQRDQSATDHGVLDDLF